MSALPILSVKAAPGRHMNFLPCHCLTQAGAYTSPPLSHLALSCPSCRSKLVPSRASFALCAQGSGLEPGFLALQRRISLLHRPSRIWACPYSAFIDRTLAKWTSLQRRVSYPLQTAALCSLSSFQDPPPSTNQAFDRALQLVGSRGC